MSIFIKSDLTQNMIDENLRDLGLDSLATIELLLEIEEYYDISFPDEYLSEKTFSTANQLWKVVIQLVNMENSLV
ncbi:acyl carrier protein [Robertmurraya kyonggiensis]|uniref:Acyl carrier protein n=1 Tax=Robertmurraya kyonggiensis TaxID=1037680 RepID=A0A4U1DFI5_9BACI|nr:acyl carrier protein [Robertmurraya kyonggiensis]